MKTSLITSAIKTLLSNKNTLPIIECVKIESNTLTVTDLNTTLIIKNIGLEGAFCVDAKQYLNVLGLCENFTASIIDNKVYFESGKDIFGYPTELVSDYPLNPPAAKFESIGTINAADLVRIKSAAKFIGTDELRPSMLNVAITKGLIAATDGHRMFFENSDLPGIDNDILINKKTCKLLELFNMPVELLSTNKTHLMFDNDAVTIIQKSIDERYPDIKSVIPEGHEMSCTVDKKLLNEALKKALTCANKTTNKVKFHINGALAISANDGDFETEFNTTISAKNTGETIDIGFNGKFVQSVLSEIDSDEITFTMSAPNRAAIFNGNILLMPVMLEDRY